MKKTLLFFNLLLFTSLYSQPPISWQKSFGGSAYEESTSVVQTSDGGYITANWARSNDGDVTGNHGYNYDCWVVKTTSEGTMEWQKAFGGLSEECGNQIIQTSEGGYILVGRTSSSGINGDVSGNHGNFDYWVVKLDNTGSLVWQKCLGGSGQDRAYSIIQTSDGNYIIAGYSDSKDGDVTGNHGSFDYWIVKISSDGGEIIWQKSYGGSDSDYAYSIEQTTDGGYIVAGGTYSTDGDVSGNHGNWDYWVLKLDGYGTIQWKKCYGGTGTDNGYACIESTNGGYLVTGSSTSKDGDVTGNHGYTDCWIIKLNSSGTIEMQQSLGGSNQDSAILNSVHQTQDGSYIMAGFSKSNDGDVTGNHGGYDYWIVKFHRTEVGFNVEWQKSLGGSGDDKAYGIAQTIDGGYIVTGNSKSNDGDVTGNHGDADIWLVKLSNQLGLNDFTAENSFKVYPNPAKSQIQISMPNSTENLDRIVIYDVLGHCVKRANTLPLNQSTIDVSDLTKGVYLLEIATESQIKLTKKLVIE